MSRRHKSLRQPGWRRPSGPAAESSRTRALSSALRSIRWCFRLGAMSWRCLRHWGRLCTSRPAEPAHSANMIHPSKSARPYGLAEGRPAGGSGLIWPQAALAWLCDSVRACICSFACLCFSGVQLFTENLAAPSISFLAQNFHLKSRNLLTKPQSTAVKVRLKTPRNIFGQTYLCSTMNSRAVGSKRSLGGQIWSREIRIDG